MFTKAIEILTGTKIVTMQDRIREARRICNVRQMQMQAAALSRNAGEIDSDEWDGYAARYAAAVREWQVLQQIDINNTEPIVQTGRGETWVQG